MSFLKDVQPAPIDAERRALCGYRVGRSHEVESLRSTIKAFEAFKPGHSEEVPRGPVQLLTALPMTTAAWTRSPEMPAGT